MASTTISPRSRRSQPSIEELEDRMVLSTVQPTALEQVLLERLNDIRENPANYGQSIGLDLSYVSASEPLAFDPLLISAARAHSQDMNDAAFFGHFSSAGKDLGTRLRDVGYSYASYAESIAAGYANPDVALRALIIDAGIPSLGHRRHLLAIDSIFKDMNSVGVGIVENGSGPYINYFTIDTAKSADSRSFLTGSVFNDANNNGKYDAGEGVGGLTMQVQGVGTIRTFDTGGYSFPLNPGTYTVTFSGQGLANSITKTVSIGNDNVRLNILTNNETGTPGDSQPDPGTPPSPEQPPVVEQPPANEQPPVSQPGSLEAARTWVGELGQRLLGRSLYEPEISHWANYLSTGGQREEVMRAFTQSPEYQRRGFDQWAAAMGKKIVKRDLTPGEISHFGHQLQHGASKVTVISGMMSLAGYQYLSHSSWLRQLSQAVLQRDLNGTEMNAWSNYLSRGGSRTVAIDIFLRTNESQQLQRLERVRQLVSAILGTTPTLSQQYTYATYLQADPTEYSLVNMLVKLSAFNQAYRSN